MAEDVARGDPAAYFRDPLTAFHRAVLKIRRAPRPVLASVHGAFAGFAFNLMLACDLRIAAEGTRFTQAFVRLGLSPDGGGTWVLPHLLGHARACEIAMLPTELTAERARDLGLINWVVPPEDLEEETERRAREIAAGPTAAIARMKELMVMVEDRRFEDHIEAER